METARVGPPTTATLRGGAGASRGLPYWRTLPGDRPAPPSPASGWAAAPNSPARHIGSAGIALAALHFLLGGLILARRFWPVLVTVLLVLSIVTLFPLGLRISWPFLSLTILYAASLLLTIARQAEFG
jgi:hypothetical protein